MLSIIQKPFTPFCIPLLQTRAKKGILSLRCGVIRCVGADTTCAALMQAVVAALKAAGATDEDIAALKAKDGPKLPAYVDEEITVDVLVAGAGAGGGVSCTWGRSVC